MDEARMMFAVAGGDISDLMEPGIDPDRIKIIATTIMKKSGLRWDRVLVNIALATDKTLIN